MSIKYLYTTATIIFSVLISGSNVWCQPSDFVKQAVRATEEMLDSKGDKPIIEYIDESMTIMADRDKKATLKKLSAIRAELSGIRDNIMVEAAQDGVILILSNDNSERHLKIILDYENEFISDLYILDQPDPIVLTIDNLAETFNQLEREGMAGVVHVKLNGEIIFKHAFGPANKSLGIKNSKNTIFGIGSRPIDFTIAAIHLLDQRGLLNIDDTIGAYFDHVPKDKQSITIRHLLTGQSGLPDFFHTQDDWDPDLAWIDKQTAVERLLAQELHFEPGTSRQHAHGAFVLLAALIENVSGMSYYNFLKYNFFDPAGMQSTGEYGDRKSFDVPDFAVGGGPQQIGIPNIPPNWGPTSWLIKGSGGMYSNLDDLLKFYKYVRSEKILDGEHNQFFLQPTVNIDGSDRGFELFSAYYPPDDEIYLFINDSGNRTKFRQLIRGLERLVIPEE